MTDPTQKIWISCWIALSAAVCTWDALFCLCRPYSLPGNSLSKFWAPYKFYIEFDLSYGMEHTTGFINAQAVGNLIEVLLDCVYLYLVHGVATKDSRRAASLIAIMATLMTGYKTVIFILQEYYSDFSSIRHNPFSEIFLKWVFPQTLFVLLPLYLTYMFGDHLLSLASGLSDKKRS
ncbi:hypothetical protein V1517DRAFT_327569 [Lipomyces orientalis]|uniref:Uncharacterized protein n=1 Tax=Lipomyces orientalis TaxID=1233043 RepID=A0ACC3TJE2_9ASCO